jgi:lipocalin
MMAEYIMRGVYVLLLLGSIGIIFLSGCRSVKVDNTPIMTVDLQRYLGQWYEIARLDHYFERGMEQTVAEYTKLDDGYIQVINSGFKDGNFKTSVGKARVTATPGLLRVSFFGPFYSDYRILMLDENYQYALVGGSSYEYLWILSRTPVISNAVKSMILVEAQRRGYDIDKLIWVKQNLNGIEFVSEEIIVETDKVMTDADKIMTE